MRKRAEPYHVEVFHWNPRRPVMRGRTGVLLPVRRRVNNFGDLLGPLIVQKLVAAHGLDITRPARAGRLLSVGSVVHFANSGDTVWGAGVNGKIADTEHRYHDLDVRAVRGPITKEFLERRGVRVPEIFGDPGILLGTLMPELLAEGGPREHRLTVVPNLNDIHHHPSSADVLDPRSVLATCIDRIRRSDLVVGSSLHGIVVAEALGVPARPILSGAESPLKYEDYFAGTGRSGVEFAHTVPEAIEMGGVQPPVVDHDDLLAAFPIDLWQREQFTQAYGKTTAIAPGSRQVSSRK